MNNYICIDSSVLLKVLIIEEDSTIATELLQSVIERKQIIVLPAFAWAEVGSVLRKKSRKDDLAAQEADDLWMEFRKFSGITYLEENAIMDRAWRISRYFDMPTLYDAAYLAVCEIIEEQTNEVCEFWTADERLVNTVKNKKYVNLLRNFLTSTLKEGEE